MYHVEHEAARQYRAEVITEARRSRLVGQARKVRKRDGSSGYAEAGDQRPPAVDC